MEKTEKLVRLALWIRRERSKASGKKVKLRCPTWCGDGGAFHGEVELRQHLEGCGRVGEARGLDLEGSEISGES